MAQNRFWNDDAVGAINLQSTIKKYAAPVKTVKSEERLPNQCSWTT